MADLLTLYGLVDRPSETRSCNGCANATSQAGGIATTT
jgi:hypothetical protein